VPLKVKTKMQTEKAIMELLDIGKKPIPGPNPEGRDVRSESIYDNLFSEINKSSSISASSPVQWERVVELSRRILEEYSKDILVCSYLCVGLLKTKGLRGLAIGFHIYRDLLEVYWDSMFPPKKRMRGRLSALEWWIDTLEDSLSGMQPEVWRQHDMDNIFADLDAINTFLGENIDEPPDLRPVISLIGSLLQPEEIKTEEAKTKSAEEIKKQEPAQVQTTVSQQQYAIPLSDIVTTDDVDRAMRVIFDAIRKVCNALVSQRPLPALYFRLNRFVAWATVDCLPVSDSDGKTMLPPPEEQLQGTLKTLYRETKWQELLESAEVRIPEFLFWIDLNRYVTESLEHLNQKDIAREIEQETVLYTNRLKGIEKLSFSDGTPFADEITREWLENIKNNYNTKQNARQSELTGYFEETLKKDTEEAESIAAVGDISGALRVLRDKIGSATSERERFIREIWFCRFLLKIEQVKLSMPYFRKLLSYIDTYKTELWEPLLAIDAYKTILSGLKRQRIEGGEALAEETVRRLSLVDPAGALNYLV